MPPGYLSATSIALGDLDGDGDLDAVLGALDFLGYGGGTGYAGAGTSESSRNNRLYRNDGSGHFEDGTTLLPPGFRANDVALGDVDGDGDLDAALACIEIAYVGYGSQVLVAAPNALLLNDGSGAFADGSANLPPLAELSLALALTDLDRDGDLDLYVGNAGPDHLFLNDGSGAFVDASSGLPTRPVYTPEVVAGDVDGDGDTDLLLVESSPRILLNDGSARFQEAPSPFPTVANPNTAALLDVDEDGDLDVLFGAPWGNRLLHNDGRGAFTDASSELPGGYARTTAFAPGDVDGDGDPDVLVVSDAYPEVEDRLFVNVSRGIAHRGAPRVGQPLRMDLYGTPGAPWILARAPEPAQVPLGALGTLFLAPGRLRFVATGRLDATGRASWSAPVPPDPELVGRSVDWQALVGSPNRLTNRDRTTLGG